MVETGEGRLLHMLSKGHQLTMRIKRIAAEAGVAAVGIAGFAAAASSATSITAPASVPDAYINPPKIPTTITFHGLAARQYGFISQCRKTDADPTFNYAIDCSSYNATQFQADSTGTGTGNFNLFVGIETINAEWGCGVAATANDPNFDPSAPAIGYSTCYIRVAPDTQSNTASDFFQPIAFVPPAQTPEVPLNVLLPLGGAAVLGGAYMVSRKRQMANVA